MKKRIVAAVLFAGLLAVSAYAQTANIFPLISRGTPQQIQAAIRNGADVNASGPDGYSALIIAVEFSRPSDVLSVLIAAGADVNAQTIDGMTALMFAASGDPEAISVLLGAGADVNAQDNNDITALMYAAHFQSPEIIAALLEAGADTNAKDIAGQTAFHYAQDNEKLKGTDAYRELQRVSK